MLTDILTDNRLIHWPSIYTYTAEVLAESRSSVGRSSVGCWSLHWPITVPVELWPTYWSLLDRNSTDTQPTLDLLSAKIFVMYRQRVYWYLADLSHRSQSITLPKVNMILMFQNSLGKPIFQKPWYDPTLWAQFDILTALQNKLVKDLIIL